MKANKLNYYYRDHRNDFSTNKSENTYYSVAKRVATTALPFIGLYKPLEKTFTIGTSALRCATNIQQLTASLDANDSKAIAKSVLDVSLTIASIAGTIFLHPLGMLVTTSHDLILNGIRIIDAINEKDKNKLLEEILHIGSNSFYLLSMIYGSLGYQIATTTFQILLNSHSTINNLKQKNYIEATGSILMTALKTNQLAKQVISFQKQSSLERLLKELKTEYYSNEEINGFGNQEKVPLLSEALINKNEDLALKILELFPEQALGIISTPIYGKYDPSDKKEFLSALINARPLNYAIENKHEKVASKILDIQIDALKYATQDELKARIPFFPSSSDYNFHFKDNIYDYVEGFEHKILYSQYKSGLGVGSNPTYSTPVVGSPKSYVTYGMIPLAVINNCSDDLLKKMIYYQMLHHTMFRKEQPFVNSYKDIPVDVLKTFRKYCKWPPLREAFIKRDFEGFKTLVKWGTNTAVNFGDSACNQLSIISLYEQMSILLFLNKEEGLKYINFLLDNKYPIPSNVKLINENKLFVSTYPSENTKDGWVNENYKFKLLPGSKGYIKEAQNQTNWFF